MKNTTPTLDVVGNYSKLFDAAMEEISQVHPDAEIIKKMWQSEGIRMENLERSDWGGNRAGTIKLNKGKFVSLLMKKPDQLRCFRRFWEFVATIIHEYYHYSERDWLLPDILFGHNPKAYQAEVRYLRKLRELHNENPCEREAIREAIMEAQRKAFGELFSWREEETYEEYRKSVHERVRGKVPLGDPKREPSEDQIEEYLRREYGHEWIPDPITGKTLGESYTGE